MDTQLVCRIWSVMSFIIREMVFLYLANTRITDQCYFDVSLEDLHDWKDEEFRNSVLSDCAAVFK
jgi:hypothetical protein